MDEVGEEEFHEVFSLEEAADGVGHDPFVDGVDKEEEFLFGGSGTRLFLDLEGKVTIELLGHVTKDLPIIFQEDVLNDGRKNPDSF